MIVAKHLLGPMAPWLKVPHSWLAPFRMWCFGSASDGNRRDFASRRQVASASAVEQVQPLGPLGIRTFPTVAIADPLLAQGGVIQRLDNNRMRHDRGFVAIRQGNRTCLF